MTILLSRSDTASLLDLATTVNQVEAAFAAHGRGEALAPTRVHVHAPGGGFHVVVGGIGTGSPPAFSTKINASFEPGPGQGGLRMVGLVVLSDASSGEPLAVMDSGPLTTARTAAVSAVALRHLARADSHRLLVVGAGRQAVPQLAAARMGCPSLETVRVWSPTPARRDALARRWSAEQPDVAVTAVDDLAEAVAVTDAIITITPSHTPLIDSGWVAEGTTIVAIGSDAPGKHELDVALVARARMVCDVVAQCVVGGELGRAIEAGVVSDTHPVGELSAVVAGTVPGRTSPDDIVVFDSTGTAMQDAAAATALWRAASAQGLGTPFDFAS
jgi:ornithine cyclodeaminase/alanine dehydrogenase-like protein (mu-crystallin family)